MGSGHEHGNEVGKLLTERAIRFLRSAVATCTVVAVAAAIFTWPNKAELDTFNLGADLFDGTVTRVAPCEGDEISPGLRGIECIVASAEVSEGIDAGQVFELAPLYEGRVDLEVGDEVVLARVQGDGAPFRYSFFERDRQGALLALAALFALTVVLLGRLRGVAALIGLLAGAAVLGLYTLPALLDGGSSLVVSCVSAALIAVVALYTSHGFGPMTTVAVLGTLLSLFLIVVLGVGFIELTQLSGFATEESLYIEGVGDIDVRGLLLAGLVIGALGALDDMTVTQASVVFELRRASPDMTSMELFASAMRVGRDHVASTVNTLFLAYAGASLPLLLLFSIGERGVFDVANSEIVATEIVRTLVGSIGLVASVPLTTWLAVAVVGDADANRPLSTRPGLLAHQLSSTNEGESIRRATRRGIDD